MLNKTNIIEIFLLGFSSGLPFALTTSTLSIWLTETAIDVRMIGLFSIVTISYSMKFFWAPFIDNLNLGFLSKRFGRKISWIIMSQIGLFISIITLGFTDPTDNVIITAICAFLVVLCSATQDIAIDGYRIKLISEHEQGLGAMAINYGYRIGVLFTGAGALLISEYYSWSIVYMIAASGMIIGIITSLSLKNICESSENLNIYLRKKFYIKKYIIEFIIKPFKEFKTKNNWIYIMLFAVFFRLGDSMADVMSNSFYINLGYSKNEIATIVKTFGLIAILLGSFFGGIMIYKVGMKSSLWICGTLQMLSNTAFAVLANIGYDPEALSIVIAIENLSSGAAATCFVAYLSNLCNFSSFTSTHYAMLSSLSSVGRNILSSPSGYIVKYFDWFNFYLFTIFAAIPGLYFLYLITKDKKYN